MFFTILSIVLVLLICYYAGMIIYDLYVAKMKKQESEEAAEEPIDVSDQLNGFESYDISGKDGTTTKRTSIYSNICKAFTAIKMNKLMEDAAAGGQNPELNNILFLCEKSLIPTT